MQDLFLPRVEQKPSAVAVRNLSEITATFFVSASHFSNASFYCTVTSWTCSFRCSMSFSNFSIVSACGTISSFKTVNVQLCWKNFLRGAPPDKFFILPFKWFALLTRTLPSLSVYLNTQPRWSPIWRIHSLTVAISGAVPAVGVRSYRNWLKDKNSKAINTPFQLMPSYKWKTRNNGETFC